MEMPFKVECYSDQSPGVVLDPYKNSSYYYMKILLSVIRTRVSIIKMFHFPGAVLERSRHSTKLSLQTPKSNSLGYPDARITLVPVERGSCGDSKVSVYCVCLCAHTSTSIKTQTLM